MGRDGCGFVCFGQCQRVVNLLVLMTVGDEATSLLAEKMEMKKTNESDHECNCEDSSDHEVC